MTNKNQPNASKMNKVSGLKRNHSRRLQTAGIQDTIKVGSGVVGASLPSESCKRFCPTHAHKSQGHSVQVGPTLYGIPKSCIHSEI